MEYKYEALDQEGKPQAGVVNAASESAAVTALQHKGLTITAFSASGAPTGFAASLQNISLFSGISSRDLVILSRQMATLFEAQVSPLRVFRLLGEQAEKPFVRQVLTTISDDLQGGMSISQALSKHPRVFTDFYVNMVRAGEETGKLTETFAYLAEYIDRSYEVASKVRNALIYPGFIVFTFVTVMTLMLTIVIPKIGSILEDAGGELPVYTRIILGMSSFLVDYGIFLLIGLIVGGFFVIRYTKTPAGRKAVSSLQLELPFIGNLYQKLYLSRIADNMHVMLVSGITAVRALEITAAVVENDIYEALLTEAVAGVKAGTPLHEMLAQHPKEIPSIMVQMLQIGHETGETAAILDRLAKFYNREVNASVDTLVSLIEPIMIVMLALGVGFLLASVLLPIYNTTSSL
ncbi:MAG: Type secretion system domain, type pilus assembly protein PilC [Candidatus Adlerbacteria bacterium]|nr:Type secretion system domain, type pilus assembly protein PilC [Candidatus Adlerbacteria bacterium]